MARLNRFPVDIESWWTDEHATSRLQLVWIGQAGFLIRLGALKIAIDPYLSDSLAEKYRGTEFPHIRMMPVPITPNRLAIADIILCTHQHTDHMDPATLQPAMAEGSGTMVMVPRYAADIAISRGVDSRRLIALNAGESWSDPKGIVIRAIPAAHEECVLDRFGNHQFLGYELGIGGISVYHSGDTVPAPELEEALKDRHIDIALLPCNGRNTYRRERGVPGNLSTQEAIEYHRRFGWKATILHHFGMFDFNSEDPSVLHTIVKNPDLNYSVCIPEVNYAFEFVQ